jgi:hypothetical protein
MNFTLSQRERKAIAKSIIAGAMLVGARQQAVASNCDSVNSFSCSYWCVQTCGIVSNCVDCDNSTYTCSNC